jgi:hypothetical protein
MSCGVARVVLDPPLLDDSPCVCRRQEPVLVEAFVAEPSVEALDVRVLDRFAGPNEVQVYAVYRRLRMPALWRRFRWGQRLVFGRELPFIAVPSLPWATGACITVELAHENVDQVEYCIEESKADATPRSPD